MYISLIYLFRLPFGVLQFCSIKLLVLFRALFTYEGQSNVLKLEDTGGKRHVMNTKIKGIIPDFTFADQIKEDLNLNKSNSDGDLEDLASCFSSGRIQYAITTVQCAATKQPKVLLIHWVCSNKYTALLHDSFTS